MNKSNNNNDSNNNNNDNNNNNNNNNNSFLPLVNYAYQAVLCILDSAKPALILDNKESKELNLQPVITTRIYVLHKITIALKFMSYINSDLQILAKKLQTPG